jgi:hypothetical protein
MTEAQWNEIVQQNKQKEEEELQRKKESLIRQRL